MTDKFRRLARTENQAAGLARYAIQMLRGDLPGPADDVLVRVEQFHLDSVACALSALAAETNAPTVLRREALRYPAADGVPCWGSQQWVAPEKAVLANVAAVREWDANGTNFGYDPQRGGTAGEFGHNDFYPVVIAAAQQTQLDGRQAVVAMATLDEIRGRLAEVFALKNHCIDHVLHGGVAAAAVYGALMGATEAEIESALGLLLAHHVPFRAIRHGQQLSDSKGASAAITAEAAVVAVRRAMAGFVGPADIFRNPQALFCLFEPPQRSGESPFDLQLATEGSDFAVQGMHFKLGLYEHQSAGAVQALINVLQDHPQLLPVLHACERVEVEIYQPAYGIICDPAKRNPQTRQSADHSLPYILGRLLQKATHSQHVGWRELMLLPADYQASALADPETRAWMDRIEIRHGGPSFDEQYPDGIPTQLTLHHPTLGSLTSGLVMYPAGHARAPAAELGSLLQYKFSKLAELAVDDTEALQHRFTDLRHKSALEIAQLHSFQIRGVV